MTNDRTPTTIKKYANRRLYNTGTSAYVTLEDLATMVKRGEDFVVFDAKGGEDITRSVLAQIIFEQEGKDGQSLLPVSFLRQLIRFYGDSMQMLVPSYLELSLAKLTADKGGFRDQWMAAVGNVPFTAPFASPQLAQAARPLMTQIEEQTRQNMALFRQALTVFAPFAAGPGANGATTTEACRNGAEANGVEVNGNAAVEPITAGTRDAETSPPPRDDIGDMKRQLEDLQRRIEGLASRT